MGVKSGECGDHSVGLRIPIYLPWKVLSRDLSQHQHQTKEGRLLEPY